MKIGSHFYTAISDGVRNILKIINRKLLRYHINDLVTGQVYMFYIDQFTS